MTEWILLGIAVAIKIVYGLTGDMREVYFYLERILIAGALLGLSGYVMMSALIMAGQT